MPTITAAMCAHGRVVAQPRLSPDAATVAFLAVAAGGAAIVTTPAAGGPERVLTAEPAPARVHQWGGGAFEWYPDGRSLVYVARGGGLWRIGAHGGRPTPVVDAAPGAIASPVPSPDGRQVAWVLDGCQLWVGGIDGSDARLLTEAGRLADPDWSGGAGGVLAWHEWDATAMPWDQSRVVVAPVDGSAGPTVVAGGPGLSVAQPRFSPDGSLLAFLSDATGWLNLWVGATDGSWARPVWEEAHEHGPPSWGPGIRSFDWAPDGSGFVLARDEGGFGSLWLVGPDGDEATRVRLGRAVHGSVGWRGDRVVAVRSGARTPTQVVLYTVPATVEDVAERRVLAVGPVAGFEAADLVEPEGVRWLADDATPLEGRLYRTRSPLGVAPLLVWVHGGPTDRWPVHFNPRIAYWVDRGWNVLVPDHRGSTGHGRAFTQALVGRWGVADVEDVAAGVRAAVAEGWGDPHRVVAIGASAGGFCVLNLLASYPGLCAAGVAVSAVTDLERTASSTTAFEAPAFASLVGPWPESGAEYRSRSPRHRAEAIVDSLLVLHGLDDEVVVADQAVALVERLQGLGRPVEHHLYPGERHGFALPATVIDELARVEDFLARHVPPPGQALPGGAR